MMFLKMDLSVCTLDLTPYFAADASILVEALSESVLKLCVIENGDWKFYLFDISTPEGSLICSDVEIGEEAFRNTENSILPGEEQLGSGDPYTPLEGISLEALNKMVLRRASGEAVENYRKGA